MKRSTATVLVTLVLVASCSSSNDTASPTNTENTSSTSEAPTVTLVAHDFFTVSPAILEAFTAATGLEVEVILNGDAGSLTSKAVLTKDNPIGDVLFGVDNTFLSRAIAEAIFEPYLSPRLVDVEEGLATLVPGGQATPVDVGDVCINADIAGLRDRGLTVPESLDDLIDPRYADLLVVQNPGTSSPGLAFLLATIAAKGDQWPQWWKSLQDNGVKVVDDWDVAYNTEFSGSAGGQASGGDRPLVVSYASSPPAEVIFANPVPDTAPTAVMTSSCFRQIEFAGVLARAKNPEGARLLIDFMLSPEFQADLPLSMFVFPAVRDTPLPTEFIEFAARPEDPLELDPSLIATNRDQWIEEWTDLILR
jgi:thiamine transport system substrate-binding protein